MSSTFEDVDKLFGTDKRDQGYEILKERYNKGEKSVEILWRLAQFCYERAQNQPKEQRSQTIDEGLKYAQDAVNTDPNHFKALKWCAVLTGQTTEFLSGKKRFQEGKKFKDLLDRALALQSDDYGLFHLRGRFKLAVARLSWIERKLAGAFFGTVPVHTYQEALDDFQSANKILPHWTENLIYIAKCYEAMKDKENTKKFLTEALKQEASSNIEIDLQNEAKQLLQKM